MTMTSPSISSSMAPGHRDEEGGNNPYENLPFLHHYRDSGNATNGKKKKKNKGTDGNGEAKEDGGKGGEEGEGEALLKEGNKEGNSVEGSQGESGGGGGEGIITNGGEKER